MFRYIKQSSNSDGKDLAKRFTSDKTLNDRADEIARKCK